MSEPVRLGQILPAVLLDIAKRMEKASPFITRHLIPDARCSYSTTHNPKLKIQKLEAKALTPAGGFGIFSMLDIESRATNNESRGMQ